MKRTPFKQARNYRRGRRGETRFGLNVAPGTICAIVLHSMESGEKPDTAEGIQSWFAGPNAPVASAHKNFDSDSVAESVKPEDEAFHAPPASRWALGWEQAGQARQTAAEWHDPYSWAMLRNVAGEMAVEAPRFGIPLEIRSTADLKAGRITGIYQHDNVSEAFGLSDHWDCGLGYPIGEVVQMARDGAHTVAPPPAATVMKLGSKGEGVAFLADMGNIMARAGFAINAHGKPSRVQIPIPTDKHRRQLCTFNGAIHARVEEIQRFADGMSRMSGGPGVKITGVADAEFASIVAFWVPIALDRITKG